MGLTLKERELVAVGASVAAGCRPCTNYHVREALAAEAADAEICQAIESAVRIRKEATEAMEAHGLKLLGIGKETGARSGMGQTSRIEALVSIGAAFAVNCTASLREHLKATAGAGVAEEEIQEVATLSSLIKRVAASHVEKLMELAEPLDAAPGGCCG